MKSRFGRAARSLPGFAPSRPLLPVLLSALGLTAGLLPGRPLLAAPTFLDAIHNTGANTLTLRGDDYEFKPTKPPILQIAQMDMKVLSFNATHIVATLPANLPPGSYLIELFDSVKDKEKGKSVSSFFVTLGAVGPRGPQGAQGPKGDTGPRGPQGATGPQGPKGDRGATGPQGPKGDTGLQGPKGDTGAAGAKGDKGDPGTPGAKGDKGDPGTPGVKGDKGDKGDPGAKGDKGDKGDLGAKGDKGDPGAAGPAGPQGAPGAPGAQGLQGPPGSPGPKGDKGDPGSAIPLRLYQRLLEFEVFTGMSSQTDVFCDAGDLATGGGYTLSDLGVPVAQRNIEVSTNAPYMEIGQEGTGWSVGILNRGTLTRTGTAYVVCLDLTP